MTNGDKKKNRTCTAMPIPSGCLSYTRRRSGRKRVSWGEAHSQPMSLGLGRRERRREIRAGQTV
jgi:hypothetical protein